MKIGDRMLIGQTVVLFIATLLLFMPIIYVVFARSAFSATVLFFAIIVIAYMLYVYLSIYEVDIREKKIIIRNVFRKKVFESTDFDFVAVVTNRSFKYFLFPDSPYFIIVFKNGQKFVFSDMKARNSTSKGSDYATVQTENIRKYLCQNQVFL